MKLSGVIGITSGITLGAYGIFKGLQYKQHLDKINDEYNNAVQIHHFLDDMNFMFPKENLSDALEYALSNLKNNTTFKALIIELDN